MIRKHSLETQAVRDISDQISFITLNSAHWSAEPHYGAKYIFTQMLPIQFSFHDIDSNTIHSFLYYEEILRNF